MAAPLVALTDLRCEIGSRTVLDLPRLVIPPGPTAVLGPNGAGKTTLLRLLATVSSAAQGTILVDGVDVDDAVARVQVRRRLGFAGQEDRLPDRMRVDEFCEYIAALKEIGPRRRRRRWADWVLAEVGLDEQRRDRISTLSGGMRRRLLIAQSLIGRPDLLILDEPLVSLDAGHRSGLVKMIAASADDRTTVVATHHSDELAAVCGHVIVLAGGRLCFAGPPSRLASHATGRVWETATPVDDPTVRALGPGRFRVVGERPPGGAAVEPTVHDGYLVVLAAASVSS